METIKHMEKSVIKIKLTVLILFVFSSGMTFSQSIKELAIEQYEILESTYKEANEETIQVYFQTLEFEPWMNLLWDDDYLSEIGIGLCSFSDEEFKASFQLLRGCVRDLEKKKINSKHLEKKFRLTKNKKTKNVRFFSEAIIVGRYSFQFVRNSNNKSVHVQKKDKEGNWNYECGVPLLFELH